MWRPHKIFLSTSFMAVTNESLDFKLEMEIINILTVIMQVNYLFIILALFDICE